MAQLKAARSAMKIVQEKADSLARMGTFPKPKVYIQAQKALKETGKWIIVLQDTFGQLSEQLEDEKHRLKHLDNKVDAKQEAKAYIDEWNGAANEPLDPRYKLMQYEPFIKEEPKDN